MTDTNEGQITNAFCDNKMGINFSSFGVLLSGKKPAYLRQLNVY